MHYDKEIKRLNEIIKTNKLDLQNHSYLKNIIEHFNENEISISSGNKEKLFSLIKSIYNAEFIGVINFIGFEIGERFYYKGDNISILSDQLRFFPADATKMCLRTKQIQNDVFVYYPKVSLHNKQEFEFNVSLQNYNALEKKFYKKSVDTSFRTLKKSEKQLHLKIFEMINKNYELTLSDE